MNGCSRTSRRMADAFESVETVYKPYEPSMTVPEKFVSCPCPRCININYRDRVISVMRNMPPAGYLALYNLVMRPLLLRYCEFNLGLFPLAWVNDDPPERVPVNPMRRIFHHMCVCFHAHKAIEGNGVEDVILSIQCWSEELVAWLLRRRRKGGEAGAMERMQLLRLSASTHELGGVDVVYKRLNFQMVALCRDVDPAATPRKLCEYAFDIGRPNHMLWMARVFLDWFMRRSGNQRCRWHIREYLHSLINVIVATQRRSVERNVALAMGLHARLGSGALIAVLGPDIVPMCIAAGQVPVASWRDVMGPWINE